MVNGLIAGLSAVLLSAPAEIPPATSTIVIYRPSSLTGAAIGCPVRYRGRELVELGRGKFAEWHVAPGRYFLTNKTSSVEVTADPGQKSFVRCIMKTGMLTFRADLQLVDEESFAQHSADYEQKRIEVGDVRPSQKKNE